MPLLMPLMLLLRKMITDSVCNPPSVACEDECEHAGAGGRERRSRISTVNFRLAGRGRRHAAALRSMALDNSRFLRFHVCNDRSTTTSDVSNLSIQTHKHKCFHCHTRTRTHRQTTPAPHRTDIIIMLCRSIIFYTTQ